MTLTSVRTYVGTGGTAAGDNDVAQIVLLAVKAEGSNVAYLVEGDATSGAIAMRPPAAYEVTALSAVPAQTAVSSALLDVRRYKSISVHVKCASLDAADATLSIYGGNIAAGTTFLYTGAVLALTSASFETGISIADFPYAYLQLVYFDGANTAGTVTAYVVAKT